MLAAQEASELEQEETRKAKEQLAKRQAVKRQQELDRLTKKVTDLVGSFEWLGAF